MQTFLIVSENSSFIEKQIKKITLNLQVSPFNLIDIHPENSIGIADIRKLTQQVILMPYAGGDRAVIINSMDKSTPEAGNALLKLLEEPPGNTYIILTCANLNKLLPTVISRCQIISDNNKKPSDSFDSENTRKILSQILMSSPGERILLSQKTATNREEAIELLNNLLLTLEDLLYKPDEGINLKPKDIAQLLTKISTAKIYLDKYINFKATLDVLFLGFPKIGLNKFNLTLTNPL